MFEKFTLNNFHQICDILAEQDADLKKIIDQFGYPPMWSRPNNFESLVHIILEQQVSLASALAALNKLKEKIKEITPERFLLLTNEELKECYFSRQKTIYVRHLAESLVKGELSLSKLETMDADQVRNKLKTIKGIGDWTVDIYFVMILHHADVFPLGDLAVINALKTVKDLDQKISREAISIFIEPWKPYRTIAAMILWHYYLEGKKSPNKIN
ncbi:DNA-3-methyladenine glycosylase family protein [Pedobacter mucosus]|uniref:DNA-3-methyladenine glycosylase family protein n=1 Tax=Pedobacter mucosus TaxID=2895286 RepID=UPI001EE3D77F|nr:DNA-3-methyladenine glycosylase 2 family protein [Pedobacter mucosus]UKT65216.1 DNA-3-methyladenine glycosylase 2 family protein [Pedobacter mucosus]